MQSSSFPLSARSGKASPLPRLCSSGRNSPSLFCGSSRNTSTNSSRSTQEACQKTVGIVSSSSLRALHADAASVRTVDAPARSSSAGRGGLPRRIPPRQHRHYAFTTSVRRDRARHGPESFLSLAETLAAPSGGTALSQTGRGASFARRGISQEERVGAGRCRSSCVRDAESMGCPVNGPPNATVNSSGGLRGNGRRWLSSAEQRGSAPRWSARRRRQKVPRRCTKFRRSKILRRSPRSRLFLFPPTTAPCISSPRSRYARSPCTDRRISGNGGHSIPT